MKGLLKKLLAKVNFTRDINKLADEFKTTSTTPTHNPGNLTGPAGLSNRTTIPGITGAPVPGSSYGPLSPGGANLGHVAGPAYGVRSMYTGAPGQCITRHDGLDVPYTPKRTRAISETKAQNFSDMLDKKIALLILARLACIGEADKQALSVSIEILEMTRELVQEVFVAQIKDK